jgi:hypothetical protein
MTDYKVEDDGKGNVTIKCEFGNQYTRSTFAGMFCSNPECQCEVRSKEWLPTFLKSMTPDKD